VECRPPPLPLLPEAVAYLKPVDLEAFERAYQYSARAHEGQFRKGGAPYITHPLAVAEILAGWHLDAQTLISALLHDVVEDTGITSEDIAREFGKPVAILVDGVTKLDKIRFEDKAEAQAENFRKMLLAMARDVRVILIKLADRLHNMRTLDAMQPEKIHRIAQETLEIYAPIANRLGLNKVYQELEDIAFLHLHPNRFKVIEKAVKSARGNRKEVVDKIKAAIEAKLRECQIPAQVRGREKHLFSIYRKMQEKHLAFSEVFDIYGFRIVVEERATATWRWAPCTRCTNPFPASSRITSPFPSRTATSPCTPPCSAPSAPPWKCRSAPRKCIASPRPASLPTGSTRPAKPPCPRCRRRPTTGCRACWTSRPTAGTRRNSWNTSRWTCSPTRSTCSPPRAASSPCRAAPRRWTSPTTCTRTWATTASAQRSTANSCPCPRR
jgi:hypothetical protein